jgi:hypothetical protein
MPPTSSEIEAILPSRSVITRVLSSRSECGLSPYVVVNRALNYKKYAEDNGAILGRLLRSLLLRNGYTGKRDPTTVSGDASKDFSARGGHGEQGARA